VVLEETMTAWVQKLRDGFAVMGGKPAEPLVRRLRDKSTAHKIAHDLNRRGHFTGEVVFVTGRRLLIELPTGYGQPVESGEGTVDDL
jgi:hypothetical protein